MTRIKKIIVLQLLLMKVNMEAAGSKLPELITDNMPTKDISSKHILAIWHWILQEDKQMMENPFSSTIFIKEAIKSGSSNHQERSKLKQRTNKLPALTGKNHLLISLFPLEAITKVTT